MSATRASVLVALRRWGWPTTPMTLANYMGVPAKEVGVVLKRLYYLDRINREPHPAHPLRFLYTAKELAS